MKAKTFFLWFYAIILFFHAVFALLIGIIDPYFHYHKPLTNFFSYDFWGGERYINDGITKHFDYDALITGTSMTENFKTSEFDEIFGCHAIKVPFSGGSFKEINDNQKVAFKKHSVNYMVRSLDFGYVNADKDTMRTDAEYPTYLYDDTIFNDVKYLWNKNVSGAIKQGVKETFHGKRGLQTTFDSYANWNAYYTFNKETVLGKRTSYKNPESIHEFTAEDEEQIRQNIQQNVVDLAQQHPETQFYYFFPPYSIAYWGDLYESGALEKHFQEEKLAIDIILSCDNIHLFSFNNKHEWILNFDNYKDSHHYGEWINSAMLRLMKNDEYRITKDNAEAYLQAEREFYMNFDYNSIFVE